MKPGITAPEIRAKVRIGWQAHPEALFMRSI